MFDIEKNETVFSRTNIPAIPISAEVQERSRKNHTIILKSLIAHGQVHLGAAIGSHETTISKMKEKGVFEQMGKILAVLGLKVVPVEMKCYDMGKMNAIFALAKARMNDMDSASELSFDDE